MALSKSTLALSQVKSGLRYNFELINVELIWSIVSYSIYDIPQCTTPTSKSNVEKIEMSTSFKNEASDLYT